MHTRALALPASLLILTLAACANTTKTTNTTTTSASQQASVASSFPAALTAKIEAICAQRNTKVAAAGTTITSEAVLKHIAQGRATAEQTTLNQLNQLTIPTQSQTHWQTLITDTHNAIQAWASLAHHGITTTNKTNSLATAGHAQEKALTTAKTLGLKTCAQLP